jgi:o-succinylbenzoate synthase
MQNEECTMKIDAIDVFRLGGEPRDAVLVRIDAGGLSGWGEAAVEAAPIESEQWTGATIAFIEQCLVPEIVGREIGSAESLADLFVRFRGHSLAKGAVDCAWHDLAARIAGQPLWEFLGASGREVQFVRPFGPRETIDALMEDLGAAVAGGLTEATLKLRPGWGIDVVRVVRSAFPTLGLRVDFDGTATIDQRDLLFRLQDYQVTAIEQPLDADDLVGHAMLQESLRTPVCLDQSITSAARARMAIDLGACREVRVTPDLCGGLAAARDALASCGEAGVGVIIGSRAQTDVGLRHAAALSMHCGGEARIDVDKGPEARGAERRFEAMPAWSEAGIGCAIDSQAITRMADRPRRG